MTSGLLRLSDVTKGVDLAFEVIDPEPALRLNISIAKVCGS